MAIFRDIPDDDLNKAEKSAAKYAEAFPGSTATAPRQRLRELFAEEAEPGPIDIFQAWYGENQQLSAEDYESQSWDPNGEGGFDPAKDPAPSAHKVKIKEVYDAAVEQGLEDEARFMRNLSLDQQRRFAHLLRRHFLEEQ